MPGELHDCILPTKF